MGLPLNAIIEVSWRYEYALQQYLNIRHYRVATPVPDATPVNTEMNNFLDYFNLTAIGTITGEILQSLGNNCSIREIRVQPIKPTRMIFYRTFVNFEGDAADQADTGNVAAVISLNTAMAGRDQLGSFHLPCPPKNAMFSGQFTNAYVDGLGGLELLLKSGVDIAATGGSYLPVIFHRNALPGFQSDDIIGATRRRTVRVMRRRTVGVGI